MLSAPTCSNQLPTRGSAAGLNHSDKLPFISILAGHKDTSCWLGILVPCTVNLIRLGCKQVCLQQATCSKPKPQVNISRATCAKTCLFVLLSCRFALPVFHLFDMFAVKTTEFCEFNSLAIFPSCTKQMYRHSLYFGT